MTAPGKLIVKRGMSRLMIIGLLGGFLGMCVSLPWNLLPLSDRSELKPAPYRVPKIPGGTPLRLAMVHDILHERYLKHGAAWHLKRIAIARATITREITRPTTAPSAALLDAMDELATGLENTGEREESITVLRKKLALLSPLPATATTQAFATTRGKLEDNDAIDLDDLHRILAAQNLPVMQHHQYTACANLGTILVHSAMGKALTGDLHAKATVREGLDYIHRAIAINPGAHFGRETWQAIAIEHFLAAMDHPNLLKQYDLIGNSLQAADRGHPDTSSTGRLPRLRTDSPEADLTPSQRLLLRSSISRLGISREWADIVHPDYTRAMPFDEPTLAILGMWTLGGGPNPHFALALATIMEIVGQHAIAWNGYERAIELADKFWPVPAVREILVTTCRNAQLEIARDESPVNPQAWQDDMRRRHQKELAWGERYQKEYQEYEAAQIAAGVALDDPHFYDAFFPNHASIASPPGLADDYLVTHTRSSDPVDSLPCFMLGAGLAMALAMVLPKKFVG